MMCVCVCVCMVCSIYVYGLCSSWHPCTFYSGIWHAGPEEKTRVFSVVSQSKEGEPVLTSVTLLAHLLTLYYLRHGD